MGIRADRSIHHELPRLDTHHASAHAPVTGVRTTACFHWSIDASVRRSTTDPLATTDVATAHICIRLHRIRIRLVAAVPAPTYIDRGAARDREHAADIERYSARARGKDCAAFERQISTGSNARCVDMATDRDRSTRDGTDRGAASGRTDNELCEVRVIAHEDRIGRRDAVIRASKREFVESIDTTPLITRHDADRFATIRCQRHSRIVEKLANAPTSL